MKKLAQRSLCGMLSLIFAFCLGGCNSTEKSSNYMTATPKLAQYMVFNIYEDRVEFQMYNAGSAKGYSRRDIPKPYTVYFRK